MQRAGVHAKRGAAAFPRGASGHDDSNLAKPDITIWTKMAPSWACIDANLPSRRGPAAATGAAAKVIGHNEKAAYACVEE